jgi:hypothetical protein
VINLIVPKFDVHILHFTMYTGAEGIIKRSKKVYKQFSLNGLKTLFHVVRFSITFKICPMNALTLVCRKSEMSEHNDKRCWKSGKLEQMNVGILQCVIIICRIYGIKSGSLQCRNNEI